MSSLSSSSVRPKRAKKDGCPICGGGGCALYRAGGQCPRCLGSGRWKSSRSGCELDCLGCGGTGERHASIICRRVQSPKATKSGNGWIHSPDAEMVLNLPPAKPEYDLASIDHRHAVYSALLECLPLNKSHDQHLQNERGLSEEAITAGEFASTPGWNGFDDAVATMAGNLELSGVPGFFTVRDKWCWRGCGNDGIIIPIRDYQRRIECLQIRWLQPKNPKAKYILVSGAPDKLPHGGTRSGAPNHFIRFDPNAKTVLIVEGILKSEIVAEHMHKVGLHCPVVACVGTGSYGEMGVQLKGLMPGLRLALTAFDRNEEGKGAEDTARRRERLHGQFERVGVNAEAVEWDGFKGCDDYLLKGAL